MTETTQDTLERRYAAARAALGSWTTRDLRDLIAIEREQGRAFGHVAEACRNELARRGERA